MARIRTIQPDFARSPSMGRVSREARLLFVLLWTVVDDEGRCHAFPDDLAKVLYPNDFDAERYLESWLHELEQEGCIERYEVDEIDYLRVVRWHKHQWIGHPSRSYLPPSPQERLSGSGTSGTSGRLRGRRPKAQPDQSLAARPCTIPENGDFSADDQTPVEVTPQKILRYLDRIRINAERDRSHPNALRSVAMLAQFGLPAGKTSGGKTDEDHPPLTDIVP